MIELIEYLRKNNVLSLIERFGVKALIVALVFGVLCSAMQATWADPEPDYCAGFSPEACSRIKAVIESKVSPAYCVPGFGREDSGLNLTPEQLRICYAQPLKPLGAEQELAITEIQAKHQVMQNQKIEDARAMVRESWEKYRVLIEAIETGYKCDVIDELSTNISLKKLQIAMQDELNRSGLVGDPTMNAQNFVTVAVQTSKAAADRGACARMTPAWRGKIRSITSNFMR